MRIRVRVKPRSKRPSLTQDNAGVFVVAVQEAPADGAANDAVIRAVADHFRTAKSNVRIVRGAASRTKLIEVLDVPVTGT